MTIRSKNLHLPLLLVGLALLALALSVASCGDATQYARDGKTAFRAGDLTRARDYLAIAYREGLGADDAELRYMYAVTLLQAGRRSTAVDVLESLTDVPRFRARAITRIVQALHAQARLPEARDRLTEALKQAPGDVVLLQAMGSVQQASWEAAWEAVGNRLERYLGPALAKGYQHRLMPVAAAPAAQWNEQFTEELKNLRASGFSDESGLRDLMAQARAELQKALDIDGDVAARSPSAFEALLFMGRIAHDAGDDAGSLEHLKRLALMDPDLVIEPDRKSAFLSARDEAISLIHQSLRRTGEYARAVTFLEQVQQRYENPARLDLVLADFYFLGGRAEELAPVVERILEEDPRSAYGSFYKGWLLLQAGQAGEAVGYLERAHAVDRQSGPFNRFLGLALKASGQLTRAAKHLETAIASGERSADLVIAYAEVLDDLGQPALARRFMGDQVFLMTGQQEEQAKIYAAYRRLLARDGFDLTDLQSARKANEADPRNIYIALRRADLEREAGNYQQARALVGFVVRRSESLPDAYLVGARVEISSKRWQEALDHVAKLEELRAPTAESAWLRSEAHLGLSHYEQAREAALQALAIDDGFVQAARTLVALELQQENWEAARNEALTHLERFSDDQELLRGLIQARSRLNDRPGLVAALERLQSLRPEDPVVAFRLGQALLQIGEKKECLRWLEHAAARSRRSPGLSVNIARLLIQAGEDERAGPILEEAVPHLERGPLREAAQAHLMRSRHRLANHLGVLEIALRMRREGSQARAMNTLVRLMAEAGAWHEAAASFRLLLADDQVEPATAQPGVEALLKLESWREAQDAIKRLLVSKRVTSGAVVPLRLRALLGAGDVDAAGRLLREANSRADLAGRAALWDSWYAGLAKRKEWDRILEDLDWARSQAPRESAVFLVAARAALASKKLSLALDLAERAHDLAPDETTAADVFIAVLLANGRGEDAIKVEHASAGVAAIASALARKEPPDGTFGRYLYYLKTRRLDRAESLAARITDMPLSFRGALQGLARKLGTSREGAGLVANALGQAAVYKAAGVLAGRAARELRAAAEQHEDSARFMDLYQAWIHVGQGEGKAAAGLVGRFMEEAPQRQLVAYLVGLTTLHNTSAANLRSFLDGLAKKRRVPANVAIDLARACREHGQPRTGLHILLDHALSTNLGRVLAAELAWESGQRKQAEELALPLKIAYRNRPPYLFMTLSRDLADKQRRGQLRGILGAIVKRPELRQGADVLELLDATSDAGMLQQFDDLVAEALRTRPYDAYVLRRLLQLTARMDRPLGMAQRLRSVLNILDPEGDLRVRPHSLPGSEPRKR